LVESVIQLGGSMSKGFCVLAQGDKHIEMAKTLAESIKKTQSISDITLITSDKISDSIFDEVVDIPWMDHSLGFDHKIQNTWKYYWASPYDETIVVSPNMVIPSDLNNWWNMLSEKEMWFPCRTKNHKEESHVSSRIDDQILRVFANLFYFKKGDLSAEFFCMLEQIFHNWETMYDIHIRSELRPTKMTMNMNYSLCCYLLGYEYDLTEFNVTEIPTFVDLENDEYILDNSPVFKNKENELYISNYKQHFPVKIKDYDQYRQLGFNKPYE